MLGDGTIVHSDASEGIPVASLISEANRDQLEEILIKQQYKGGPDMVRELCREWINRYSTRKVMVQELRTMLR